jgi:hypothetical protein
MATQMIAVQVPPGMAPGQTLQVRTPDGRLFSAPIPQGVPVGGTFHVQVAAAPPPPQMPPMGTVPMGIPIEMGPGPTAAAPPRPAAPPRAQSYYNVLPTATAPSSGGPTTPTVATTHAECPICFEPLHHAPVGVFLDSNRRRVSRHFFNLAAAQEWLRSGNGLCPCTRAPVASVLPVPSILTDPDGWFRAVDIDGDGKLSTLEVIECLKAQLPMDNAALDAAAADRTHWMWQQWDADGSGFIERNELLHPQGLVAYVRTAFARAAAPQGPPDMCAASHHHHHHTAPRSGLACPA